MTHTTHLLDAGEWAGTIPNVSATFPARLFAKIDASGVCWEWTGALNKGYGVIGRGARGTGLEQAHRAVWTLLVGPIPDGMTLDHLCRNRPCCMPDHLEPVTSVENVRRGYGPGSGHYVERTVCKNGHPWTPEVYWQKGYRLCKTCISIRSAERYRKTHISSPTKSR